MKKSIGFFVALVIAGAGMLAPTGLSAQKRVIKVQGHPHELLTQKHGGKEDAITRTREVTGSTANINIADITCWAGEVDPTINPEYIDSAVLLVKWTDQKALDRGDSILIWGYRWNSISIYVDPTTGERDTSAVTKYTIDMIRAVANADCNFIALLQNTGAGNFTAGGFGYSFDNFQTPPNIIFKKTAAATDANVKFHYTGSPNCNVGQLTIPYNVDVQEGKAMDKAVGSTNIAGTGIIDHPFDADYGYPAYDYDHWSEDDDPTGGYEWQSGWYTNGYWAFYVKPDLSGDFEYPTESGIATHVITNHSVSGFVFAINMDWSKDMSGDYVVGPGTCKSSCSPSCPPN